MAEPLTYAQILASNSPTFNANFNKVMEAVNNGSISPSEFNAKYAELFGYKIKPVYGKVGQPLGFSYQSISQTTTTNPINSNISTVSRGNISTPINTTIDTATNTVRSGRVLPPSGAPSTWSYVANSIATPIIAAGIGISLGKTIDSVLYNANPDFWDSHGMSSINPETWNSLTTGVDYSDPVTGTAASLMNMIFGLNPETGETTAYVDENAYAYLAYWLKTTGALSSVETGSIEDTESLNIGNIFTLPMNVFKSNVAYRQTASSSTEGSFYQYGIRTSIPVNMMPILYPSGYKQVGYLLASTQPFTYTEERFANTRVFPAPPIYPSTFTGSSARSTTVKGVRIYYTPFNVSNIFGDGRYATDTPIGYNIIRNYTDTLSDEQLKNVYYLIAGVPIQSGMDGIGQQAGAQQVDPSSWDDLNSVLPSLQQQYPTVFDNPVQITTANPDGTETTRNYVPIPLPRATSNTDTQPTSDTQTQQDIKAKPDVTPQPIIDLLTKVIQQPETEPFNPDPPIPPNPTDTGEEEEPVTPMPTGNATALWSIYHPTQSQINSFGAWLWSSDFIDQLKKIFNNPMESIIGLHKVYATPIDAGTSTIVVGYLDSEVPSAYITQQYVTIDCGTVDINEDFGNVFDYSPYTVIKLYLPFVGIVELDPSEVMRSSVNIKYGVDVLTGACLAKVRVKRDGNSATLYQFAGNCAVQYPLSMGSYMGIVASIVGVAGSVAATVATGGGAAPLALGAIGAAFNAKTNVQNSGSFTGNAGAMGGKKPYLIIERPQTKIADNQNAYIGQPTNEYRKLSAYSGFVKCLDAHITNVNATDEELTEIQSYLSNGVLV